MGGTASSACNGSRHFRIRVFAVLALLLVLAISPIAAADTGSETGTDPGIVASPGGTATTEPSPLSDASSGPSIDTTIQSSQSSQAGAGAPGEDGTSSGPMAPAEQSETASGQAGDPPGQTGTPPGQAAEPPGQAGTPPGQAAEPDGQADQGVVIDQQVGAVASAVQDGVENVHEDVQVGQPGDTPGLTQENRVDAGASATGAVDVTTGAEPVVQQDTAATASAGQTDVGNTHVSVRVDSPGDAGPVTQLNEAAGAATAASVGDAADPESAAATAGATQEDVSNTNVSVRVFSPGDDGAVAQQNTAAAHADAGQGPTSATAAAQQDGTRNTHVSVRVGSPGTDGTVSQGNSALATTGDPVGAAPDPEVAAATTVAVTEDALDTTVTVNVPGTGLETLEVWEWTWLWENDESTGAGGAVPGDTSSWNWVWGDDGAPAQGSVTRRAATEAEQAGTWRWNWEWSRDGAAWNWGWDWARSLGCGSCIWVWNWDWRWTGAPATPAAATATTTPTAPPSPGVSQVNTAAANATVSGGITVTQDVTQGGSGTAEQYAGQLVVILQDAEAIALAHQADAASFWTSGGPVDQENAVLADAAVEVGIRIDQSVAQQVASAGGSTPEQWVGQQADVLQEGAAQATGVQHDVVLGGAGSHLALGEADATGRVAIDQVAAQAAAADGGSLEQWVGQLTVVEQGLAAHAAVVQAGTFRSRVGGGTAAAVATADGLASIQQGVGQAAARTIGSGSQTAGQVAAVLQDADAHASTAQQAGGAALPFASSEAVAANRVALVQAGAQDMLGASDLDVQGLWQESIVVQVATATSTSLGGIAGTATAANCAVTQQTAGQGIGVGGRAPAIGNLMAFCWPPAAPVAASFAAAPGDAATPVAPVPAELSVPVEDEAQLFRGGRPFAAAAGSHAAAHDAPGALAPVAPFAPPTWQAPTGAPVSQVSVLHSAQARFDTRPGSSAGAGDAGREPLLPPAGGPPAWVSALVAAAAAAGSSGIAMILLALVLVPPLVQRARDRSVVRRPTVVLSWVDVPI